MDIKNPPHGSILQLSSPGWPLVIVSHSCDMTLLKRGKLSPCAVFKVLSFHPYLLTSEWVIVQQAQLKMQLTLSVKGWSYGSLFTFYGAWDILGRKQEARVVSLHILQQIEEVLGPLSDGSCL